jgi:PAS domain S-box-containing protein
MMGLRAAPVGLIRLTRGVGASSLAWEKTIREATGRNQADLTAVEKAERHRAVEEALARSERRFREALSEVSLAAMMLDSRGTVLFANRLLLELTGWEESEVVGNDWFARFSPPEDRTRAFADYQEALARGSIVPQWRERLLTRAGGTREIEWSSAFLRDDAGSIVGIAGLGLDITERAQTQEALEASEERLRTALDTMLEGVGVQVAVRDDRGRIVDFRIAYANAAIGSISGVVPAEQVGHTILELFPAHRENGLFDAYVRVVETGVPFESGSFRYVDPDAAGGPRDHVLEHRAAKLGDGYVLSVRDISARHRAERETRRLATAIEQSAEAVVITNAAAEIEYVNPAFEQSSGYTRDEVMGKNPRILKSGVHKPAFYAAMWEVLTSGRPFTTDITNRRKDGSLFQEEGIISPVRDEAGTITSYVAVGRDVTRERAAEAAQERMARERALIAGALADVRAGPNPEATAASICRQIVSLTGVATAALFYFSAGGPAMPLALLRADGVAGVPLRQLPFRRSRILRERTEAGPWIEAWVHRPWHPYNQLFGELGVEAVALVPIRDAGRLIGLLQITSSGQRAAEQLTEILAALLEFAGFAGALLRRDIAELTEVGLVRSRIAAIVKTAAFQPFFQPILDLTTGAHVGYEALTRFASGMAPDLVFADARATGLEADLELATLEAAISAAAGLPQGAWLSLNASARLISENPRLAKVLRRSDRPIVLEVTEHVAVDDYAVLRAAIGRLRPKVHIAVDDAGSGVANFNHIVELRPAFVKLDMSIIRGIDADLARQALVYGLQHFAGEAHSQTIAEGVETEKELATLRERGVPLAQGYLLGRPAPATDWMQRGAVAVGE